MLTANPEIDRHFGWLREMGYAVVKVDRDYGGPNTTYGTEQVLVDVSYHWHDTYAQVSVQRRQKQNIEEEPYWARVSLHQLLVRRAPADVRWVNYPPNDTDLGGVFETGGSLLRTYATDVLEGKNLEELDEIVRNRPHEGVPGLDFPTDEPWFASQEGVWFTTDYEQLHDVATYLERTRSPNALTRSVAALRLIAALRGKTSDSDVRAAQTRLHELLADPDGDVRRAAANSLGELPDRSALEPLLALLADEPGDQSSPIAAAVTFIALDAGRREKQRVLAALRAFRGKGDKAAAQCDELEWRVGGGKPRGYSRLVRLWRGPDQER